MTRFRTGLMAALKWAFTLFVMGAMLYFGASVLADKADSCAADCKARGRSVAVNWGQTPFSLPCGCRKRAPETR